MRGQFGRMHPKDAIAVKEMDMHIDEAGGDVQIGVGRMILLLAKDNPALLLRQHPADKASVLRIIGV